MIPLSRRYLIVRCIVSAIASSALLSLQPLRGGGWVPGLSILAPGILFGAVVLAPDVRGTFSSGARRFAIVLASVTVYYLVVVATLWLGLSLSISFWIATCLTGIMGSLLVIGVSRLLVGIDPGSISWGYLLVFGAAGGMLMGRGLDLEDTVPLFLIGLSVWQIGVGWAVLSGRAAPRWDPADAALPRN